MRPRNLIAVPRNRYYRIVREFAKTRRAFLVWPRRVRERQRMPTPMKIRIRKIAMFYRTHLQYTVAGKFQSNMTIFDLLIKKCYFVFYGIEAIL